MYRVPVPVPLTITIGDPRYIPGPPTVSYSEPSLHPGPRYHELQRTLVTFRAPVVSYSGPLLHSGPRYRELQRTLVTSGPLQYVKANPRYIRAPTVCYSGPSLHPAPVTMSYSEPYTTSRFHVSEETRKQLIKSDFDTRNRTDPEMIALLSAMFQEFELTSKFKIEVRRRVSRRVLRNTDCVIP